VCSQRRREYDVLASRAWRLRARYERRHSVDSGDTVRDPSTETGLADASRAEALAVFVVLPIFYGWTSEGLAGSRAARR
jgi:hypothetical protein